MLLRYYINDIPYLDKVHKAYYEDGVAYFIGNGITISVHMNVSEWSVLANDMFADNKLILPKDKYRVWRVVE